MRKDTRKPETNALVPMDQTGTAIAIQELADSARNYAVNSRALKTRKLYKMFWDDFAGWCGAFNQEALPATPETLAAYATWLAGGRNGTTKPLAASSITVAMSAVKLAQRSAGYVFDDKNPVLKEVTKGIRREIAKTRTVRRVKPLLSDDLRDLLETLNPQILREARDAALLALGWAAALRRSELVGLDWERAGTTKDTARVGFVAADDTGLTVTLLTSKASQDMAQSVAVPRSFVPLCVGAVEKWVQTAQIERGTPLFRPIEGAGDGKKVGAGRLTDRHVARIIKQRIKALAQSRHGKRKMKKEEIDELVALFSGHSMRVGHVTDAAERGVPTHQIKQQTRHKTDGMVTLYARVVDRIKNNSLKGAGL